MQFKDILGQEDVKNYLRESAGKGRISHAQLFYGPEGNAALPLAIAYARFLSCAAPTAEDSCGICPACKQFSSFNYPDLHFVYPVAKTEKVKDKAISTDYFAEWKGLLNEQKYFGLYTWLEHLGIEKKQALISVHESASILQRLNLKAYSGGYKFMILWLPEKLNAPAANKLLKILEEPPAKTLFLLVSENPDHLLQTINSRCQKVFVPAFAENDIRQYLLAEEDVKEGAAAVIARLAEGNLARALFLHHRSEAYQSYAGLFSKWVRCCFKADVGQIMSWTEEVAKMDREKLKDFLHFCSATIRDSFRMNFISQEVSAAVFKQVSFELDKFAPFIHLNNTALIQQELDRTSYEIGRNANPKISLFGASLNLARYLRIKG